MDVLYRSEHLRKCAEDKKYSVKKLGTIRSSKYMQRIADLLLAETLEDVRNLPGNYHELTANRKGQWAVSLDGPYRLIFVPHEDPIPTDQYGKYLWIEIKGVEVIGIDNYHGK
ncbi:MAG: killer suppression protein HigA [Bacteroidales bacterium]|nr:killer suppression protein HigA [Bacteroidales bacterium]